MRIFSTKAYKFPHPDQSGSSVTVRARDFAEVPDWVQDTLLFRLATSDGTLTVSETRAQVAQVEKTEAADKANSVAQRAKQKAGE